jgi:hypothetical protein
MYWRRDHASFRVVDGAQMGPDDYRAAGCMCLVPAAPPDMAGPAAAPRSTPLVVVRGGIAPPQPRAAMHRQCARRAAA